MALPTALQSSFNEIFSRMLHTFGDSGSIGQGVDWHDQFFGEAGPQDDAGAVNYG